MCFPEIRPVLDDHLETFRELFPHVLFGALTRWVVEDYRRAPDSRSSTWARLIESLEQAYQEGDDDVRELIYVSFLENLPYPGEPGAEITSQLTPALAAALAEFR